MTLELVHPVSADDLEGWSRQLVLTLMGDIHGEEFDYGLQRRRGLLDPDRTTAVGACCAGCWANRCRPPRTGVTP